MKHPCFKCIACKILASDGLVIRSWTHLLASSFNECIKCKDLARSLQGLHFLFNHGNHIMCYNFCSHLVCSVSADLYDLPNTFSKCAFDDLAGKCINYNIRLQYTVSKMHKIAFHGFIRHFSLFNVRCR